MRNLCAVVLSAALLTTSAFAAGSNGVLAPGKPAGVKQAQSGSTVALIIGGTALVIMGAAMVGSGSSSAPGGANNQNGGTGSATTST